MIIQKYKRGLVSLLLAVVVALAGLSAFAAPTVYAVPSVCAAANFGMMGFGVAQLCPQGDEGDCSERPLSPGNCAIICYLQLFINILSAVVGIVAVIMLVVGGIQYSAARDNPQAAAAARARIAQTVLALVFYFFIYIFLQWLVPGGVL